MELWKIHEECSDLIVDGEDRATAITMAHALESTPELRTARAAAHARRIVACVNAFTGIPTDRIEKLTPADLIGSLIELYRDETHKLREKLTQADAHLKEIDAIIDEEHVAVLLSTKEAILPAEQVPVESGNESCINPIEDFRRAIKSLKQKAERAEAKVPAPSLQFGDIVRVDHERYHGLGIVDDVILAKGPMVKVRLENGNIWKYEAETVDPEPINIESLPENHWIRRQQPHTEQPQWACCGRYFQDGESSCPDHNAQSLDVTA